MYIIKNENSKIQEEDDKNLDKFHSYAILKSILNLRMKIKIEKVKTW